jgi:hypothetical protein
MPTVTFLGPFFERPMRHTMGMWTRGEVVEVSQHWLDEWRHTLPASRFLIEGDNGITIDADNDGLPDTGWSRKDILAWLKAQEVPMGAGYLTKTAALKLVEEHLNPTPVEESLSEVEPSEETTGDEQ